MYTEFTRWQRKRVQYEKPSLQLEVTDAKTLTEAEKKERKRQLNVIHSRQKRERRKAEADELKHQVTVLKQNHKNLASENAELEHMLVEVQRKIAMFEQGRNPMATSASLFSTAQHHPTVGDQQFLARQMGAMYGGYSTASAMDPNLQFPNGFSNSN